MRETLPGLREPVWRAGRARAFRRRHRRYAPANLALAAELTPGIAALLCRGGVLVSDPPIEAAELEPLPLPDGMAPQVAITFTAEISAEDR